jgi:pimeloyl-ACP methyl ester carboxylesterase
MNSMLSLQNMQIAFSDDGTGITLVLAHCSCANNKEWKFLHSALQNRYRMLAPDLLGYGKSSAWPLTGAVPSLTDVDVLEAMVNMSSVPVHLIGHSYGGAMCLEVARRDAQQGRNKIRSMCLIEPVAFYLMNKQTQQQAWQEISRHARRCIEACDKGNYVKAANIFMSYWIGMLKWRLASRHFRAEVIRTIHKVAHEFRGMFQFDGSPDDYRQIQCPVTLIYGKRSRRPAIAVVDALQDLLSQGEIHSIASAGHMSPYTHPQEVARLIESHLNRVKYI